MSVKIVNVCSHIFNSKIINSPDLMEAVTRQINNPENIIGKYKFVFQSSDPCDYLIVYCDLNRAINVKCKPENTIHIAGEPPAVFQYTKKFLQQFALIVSQDEHASHPLKIMQQSGLIWYIGWHSGGDENKVVNLKTYHSLLSLFDLPKTKLLSIIVSSKIMTPVHRRRQAFLSELKQHYKDQLDIYGRGYNDMPDKAAAHVNYRFSIVIENSFIEHYFSEKFSDCVIAGSYPLYYGCPNLEDYMPKNSFQRIDVNDLEGSIQVINNAIHGCFDVKYKKELRLARDAVMSKYNLFNMLVDLIDKLESKKIVRKFVPKHSYGMIFRRRYIKKYRYVLLGLVFKLRSFYARRKY